MFSVFGKKICIGIFFISTQGFFRLCKSRFRKIQYTLFAAKWLKKVDYIYASINMSHTELKVIVVM